MTQLYILCWYDNQTKSEFRRKYYKTQKQFNMSWNGEVACIKFHRYGNYDLTHIKAYYTDLHTSLCLIREYP